MFAKFDKEFVIIQMENCFKTLLTLLKLKSSIWAEPFGRSNSLEYFDNA